MIKEIIANQKINSETAMMQSYRVGKNKLEGEGENTVISMHSALNKTGTIDVFALDYSGTMHCILIDPNVSTGRTKLSLSGQLIKGIEVSPNLADPESPEAFYQRTFAWASAESTTSIYEIHINAEKKEIELELLGTIAANYESAKACIGCHVDGLFMVLNNVLIRLDAGHFEVCKTEIPGQVKPKMRQSSNGTWPLLSLVAAETSVIKGWEPLEFGSDTVFFENTWATSIDGVHPNNPQFDFCCYENADGRIQFYVVYLQLFGSEFETSQIGVTEVTLTNGNVPVKEKISEGFKIPSPEDFLPPQLKIMVERNSLGDTSIFTGVSIISDLYIPPVMGPFRIDTLSVQTHFTKTFLRAKPEDPLPAERSWTKMMPFSEDARYFNLVTCNRLPNSKFPMAYLVDNDFKIIEYYQRQYSDEKSYQKRWSSRTVEWSDANISERDQPLLEGKCFHTTIRIKDEYGEPVPLTEVFITPSNYYPSFLNGEFKQMTALQPQSVVTNEAGEISIEYELENSGHAPSLLVSTVKEGHNEYNSSSVFPDEAVYEKYKNISDQDLLSDTGGYQVIPPDKLAAVGAVKDALRQICSHEVEPIDFTDPIKGLERRLKPKPNQSPWVLDFTGNIPIFAEVDEDTFVRLREEYPDISSLADTTAFSELGFDPIGWAITTVGDAVESAANFGAEIVNFAVEGLNAVISFVMEDLKFSLVLELELVRDALGAVQVVFDQVGTVAGVVIGWTMNLLGFLFNWDEIKRMKTLIEGEYASGWNHFSEWITEQLSDSEEKLESLIDKISKGLSGPFQMTPEQGGDNKMDSFGTKGVMQLLPESAGPSINPINKFFDLATKELTQFAGGIHIDIPVEEVKVEFEKIQVKIQDKLVNEAEEAIERIKKVFDPPQEFAKKSFNELLTLIKESVLLFPELLTDIKEELVALANIIKTSITKVFEALMAEIYVPVLSSIYKGIFGTPMTILGLLSLLAAIPLSFAGLALGETVSIEAGCIVAAVMSCLSAIVAIGIDKIHKINGGDGIRATVLGFYFGMSILSTVILANTAGMSSDEMIFRYIYGILGVFGLMVGVIIEGLTEAGCRLFISILELLGGTVTCIISAIEIFIHENERLLLGGLLADSCRFIFSGGARLTGTFRVPAVAVANIGLGATAAGLYGAEAASQ
jgi:hypothetical protein